MKTPRSFSQTRFVSTVRFTIAGTLLCAAAAMAFVAVKPSGPFLLGKSGNTDQEIKKFRQDRDQMGGNRRTIPGPEIDRGPIIADQERYAHRAYPASDVPFRLTRNAQNAWATNLHNQRLQALGCSRGRRCLAHEHGACKPANLDIRLGQFRDQCDRDANLRRCDRHPLRGNWRAKRIG